MKTLHLVLKSKWYDLIDCGAKTSEFRECKSYWNKRFGWGNSLTGFEFCFLYDSVCFHRGYTSTTMEFYIDIIHVITGKPNDLGLEQCWEIKLGDRLK